MFTLRLWKKSFKRVSEYIRRVQRIVFRLKRLSFFFFEKLLKFYKSWNSKRNWFRIFHQTTDKVVMTENYVLSGTLHSKTLLLMISCFKFCFRSLWEENFECLMKVQWHGCQSCFLRVQNNAFRKIIFAAKFVFYSIFGFHERDSDFQKRLLSGLLKKYSTCPEGRCFEKTLFLNKFYNTSSPPFSNLERKEKSALGERCSESF